MEKSWTAIFLELNEPGSDSDDEKTNFYKVNAQDVFASYDPLEAEMNVRNKLWKEERKTLIALVPGTHAKNCLNSGMTYIPPNPAQPSG